MRLYDVAREYAEKFKDEPDCSAVIYGMAVAAIHTCEAREQAKIADLWRSMTGAGNEKR